MGSKRSAGAPIYGTNNLYSSPMSGINTSNLNVGSSTGRVTHPSLHPPTSTNILSRTRALTAVQAATAQSHFLSCLEDRPASFATQATQTPSTTQKPTPSNQSAQVTPQPQPQGHLPHGQPLPTPLASYTVHSERVITDFMLTVISIMESQPRRLVENLAPQFTALRAEIDSVKASLDQVKNDVSKFKESMNTTIGARQTNDVATTKVLSDLTEKAKSFEAFLGERQTKHDMTVMGRLEEIRQFVGDISDRLADRETDASLKTRVRPTFRWNIDTSKAPTLTGLATPQAAATPRPSCSRSESPTQGASIGPTPATDVDMTDGGADFEPEPEPEPEPEFEADPSLSTRPALPHLQKPSYFTSSPKASRASSEHNGRHLECSVSPILKRQGDEVPQGFSRTDWTQEDERRSPSTPFRQSTAPPIAESCLGTSKIPLHPQVNIYSKFHSVSPRPPLPVDVELRAEGSDEVQQLPSPLELRAQPHAESSIPEPHPELDVQSQQSHHQQPLNPSTQPQHLESFHPVIATSFLNSTGLFSPVSPQPPGFTIPKNILSLLQEEERSAASSPSASGLFELPELGYPVNEDMALPEVEDDEDEREDGEELGGEGGEDGDGANSISMNKDGDNIGPEEEVQREEMEVEVEQEGPAPVEWVIVEKEEEEDPEEEDGPRIAVEDVITSSSPVERGSRSPAPVNESVDQAGQPEKEIRELQPVTATKVPLFLPDSRDVSRIATMSPAQIDRTIKELRQGHRGMWEQEQEGDEVKEEEASRSLLSSPGPSHHQTPLKSSSPRERQESAALQSLPLSPFSEKQHQVSPSPSSWLAPTSPIRRKTPIIDVSQVMPSQSQPPSPRSLSPLSLNNHDGIDANITSPEAAHVTAQLTTLSEPESSEDEDESDEEEVDELLPSESVLPSPEPELRQGGGKEMEDIQETFSTVDGDQTVVAESSIQTFTSRLGEGDSIPSFGAGKDRLPPVQMMRQEMPSAVAASAPAVVDGTSLVSLGRNEPVVQEPDQDQMQLDPQDSSEFPNEPEPPSGSPFPEPSPPPSPEIQTNSAPEIVMHPPSGPVSPVQTRVQRPAPATPVALPEYLSPVNTPSPSRSPRPSRGFGINGSKVSRKRKSEEIKFHRAAGARGNTSGQPQPPTQQVQTPALEVQRGSGSRMKTISGSAVGVNLNTMETPTRWRVESPLKDRVRMMKTSSSASASTSPVLRFDASASASVDGSARKDVMSSLRPRVTSAMNTREGGSQKRAKKQEKVAEREGSPIYISSTPTTPTQESDKQLGQGKEKNKRKEVGKGVDPIDLTESPALTRIRAKPSVKEKVIESGGVGTSPIQSEAVLVKSRAQRENERREEQDRKEKEEQEKRENEKKRKREKEKMMMPVGTEDSDGAEVIPAKSLKKPIAIESAVDERDEDPQVMPKPTQKPPIVDLGAILARQSANGKESRASTRVKRRGKQSAGTGANISAPIIRRDDDEPPLKRARLRSEDRDSTVSRGSVDKGLSRTVKEEKGKEKEKGTKPRSKTKSGGLDLTYDPPSSPVRVKWSVKRHETRFDKNFIECDMCSTWYHYGCVGIQTEDVRLKDTEIFACPPCLVHPGQRDPCSPKRSKRTNPCGRPDCTIKQSIPGQDEFFVKRIIGRRVRIESGRERVEEYLVEWDGYPIGESTWEGDSSMANPTELIGDFIEAAEREGINLDENPNKGVLLKDARRSGWRLYDA